MTILTIFDIFSNLSELRQEKKIKIKKVAAQNFKNCVSTVSIPKMRILAQILRPHIFSQKPSRKLPTFQNV